MSNAIFYALISKSSNIILTEYTDYSGNFLQITRILLRKLPDFPQQTITYDKYTFHYIINNDFTYLCLTENCNKELAFAFLRDLQYEFLSKYQINSFSSFTAYQLTEFDKAIKMLLMYYNRNPKLTKSGDIIRDLNEVIGIKEDTIENIFEKEEKIGIVAIKGERFKMQSMGSFDLVYKEVEQKKKRRKKQIIICVIIVIFIIFMLICLN